MHPQHGRVPWHLAAVPPRAELRCKVRGSPRAWQCDGRPLVPPLPKSKQERDEGTARAAPLGKAMGLRGRLPPPCLSEPHHRITCKDPAAQQGRWQENSPLLEHFEKLWEVSGWNHLRTKKRKIKVGDGRRAELRCVPALSINQGPHHPKAGGDMPKLPPAGERRGEDPVCRLSPSQNPDSHLKVTGKTRNFAVATEKTLLRSPWQGCGVCLPAGTRGFHPSLG